MSHIPVIDRLRAWLPLLPVLALLLGSYWLHLQVGPLAPSTGAQRHDVDFVIERLNSTTLDIAGQPRLKLSTDKMWHYPDDDTTHLQNPRLSSFAAGRAPTEIRARQGLLSSGGDELTLQEEVRILRPGLQPLQDQHFHTEHLRVFMELGTAETDFPVLVFDRRNTINAIGMRLDNEARTVRLLKQVRSVHEQN
jgi:lipopolysaccharide export system protein LptC